MTSAPYRDQFAFVREVEQHVGIALALLEQYERAARALLMGSSETAEFAEAYELARRTWQDLWQQLEQARDLARKAGRDVGDVGRVYARAAIWSVDGPATRGPDVVMGRRILKSVSWRDGNLVRTAVAALAAAVPEAVLAAPPPVELPRSWLARWWWVIGLFVLFTLIGVCSQ